MEQTITLKDAITIIDGKEPFDIQVVTCDRKRGTGGELRVFQKCIKSGRRVRESTESSTQRETRAKARNHKQNDTVTLYCPLEKEHKMVDVHIRLITHINGRRVL